MRETIAQRVVIKCRRPGLRHFPVSVVILQNVYGMPRDKAIATVAVIAGFFLLLGVGMILLLGMAFFMGAGQY